MLRLQEEWRERLDNKTVAGILMDLSKAFDSVPHDVLLAKLATCCIVDNLVLYIHSCYLNRKQGVRIDSILSEFNIVVSGVPQGSIVGPILLTCFFKGYLRYKTIFCIK